MRRTLVRHTCVVQALAAPILQNAEFIDQPCFLSPPEKTSILMAFIETTFQQWLRFQVCPRLPAYRPYDRSQE